MPDPKRRLSHLKFDRVDLVDQGANYDLETGDGAHILLAKALHADDDDKKKKPKGKLPAFLRGKRTDEAGALCDLLPSIITVVETTVDALTKATPIAKDRDALSFADALFSRKIGEVQYALGTLFGALMESVDSVMFSDEPKKKEAVAERVGQFVASVKSAIPDLLKDLEKRDQVDEILGSLLTLEDVDTGDHPMAFKKSDLEGDAIKAYEALETSIGTLTKQVADLTKAAAKPADGDGDGDTQAQALAKVSDPAVRALLKQSFADTKKANERAAKAEQTAEVEKQARLIRVEVDLLKAFRNLTFNPTDDAPHVLLLKAVGEGKPWARMTQVLKAADALLKQRPVFREVGKASGDGNADSAVAMANAKAAEFIAKDDKLDVGQALKKVFAEHPDWYDAYRAESELRVGSTDDDDDGDE